MSDTERFDLWVGSELGLLKGKIHLVFDNVYIIYKTVQEIKKTM